MNVIREGRPIASSAISIAVNRVRMDKRIGKMTVISITTNKERTANNIKRNCETPYIIDFIELDNPKMDGSLNEIADQVINKIVQTTADGYSGWPKPINRVPIIVDVDNPAIEAYLVVKLMNDIFISPSEKLSDMPILTVSDIIVAPTENDLTIIDIDRFDE